jgi:hypothetical protein
MQSPGGTVVHDTVHAPSPIIAAVPIPTQNIEQSPEVGEKGEARAPYVVCRVQSSVIQWAIANCGSDQEIEVPINYELEGGRCDGSFAFGSESEALPVHSLVTVNEEEHEPHRDVSRDGGPLYHATTPATEFREGRRTDVVHESSPRLRCAAP